MAERFGKYLLLRKLATGGMAEIFLAKQTGVEGFEKIVVIKRILPHLSENEEFVNMFLDEARIAAQLTHPNIVQIFDLGKTDGSYYIAMEYIHGEDLSQLVKQGQKVGRPLPMDHVVKIIAMTCEGLYYAHTKADIMGRPLHIVHRDISPQNIIVTYEGSSKLVDFGIAKAATQAGHTRAGVLKGKFAYMSPEQVLGEELDGRSDIFAIGIILYELCVGRRLFKRDSEPEIMRAITEGQVPPPHKINPDVPPELETAIMRSLATNRDERYPDARRMQMDLERLFRQGIFNSSTIHVSTYMRKIFAEKLQKQREMLEKAQVETLDQLLMQEDAASEAGPDGFHTDYDDFFERQAPASGRRPPPGGPPGPPPGEARPASGRGDVPVEALGGMVERHASRPSMPAARASGPSPDLARSPTGRMPGPSAQGAKFAPEAVRSGLELDLESRPPSQAPSDASGQSQVTSTTGASRLTPSQQSHRTMSGMVQMARVQPGTNKTVILAAVGAVVVALLGLVAVFWGDIQLALFPPETPAVEFGTIRVESDPSGAIVNVDGTEYPQRTPAVVERVSLNVTHYIKVSKPGFFEEVEEASVSQEKPTEVIKVVLKPDAGTKGRIRVTTRPPKAQVYLDGQRRCKATPCYIAKVALAVPLELRVEKKGYQTERRELKVEDAETALPVHISLNRAAGGKPDPGAAPALLSINSVPSGAKVMLDGEMTGELTPVEDLEIPAGRKVTVALAKKGFKLYSTTIIIKAGQRKDIPLAVLARLGSTGAPSEGPTDGGSALPPTGPGGKQGYLNVTVNVPCDVLVDGQRIGPAPVRRHLIAAGPHQVRLVNEDEWLDKKFRVLIKAGESVDRPLQLRKGRLTFAALPGTEIFIGKRKLGQTPMQAVSLFEGKYTFRVVDSQLGKSKTITEMVEAGKNKIVDIEIK